MRVIPSPPPPLVGDTELRAASLSCRSCSGGAPPSGSQLPFPLSGLVSAPIELPLLWLIAAAVAVAGAATAAAAIAVAELLCASSMERRKRRWALLPSRLG